MFEDDKTSLTIYSFMYAPDDEVPCPMCASLLDGLDGQAIHITDRVNFAVAAKARPEQAEVVCGVGCSHARIALAMGVEEEDFLGEYRPRMGTPQPIVDIPSNNAPVHQGCSTGEDVD